jgi:anti-anti-sigma regulatory factor
MFSATTQTSEDGDRRVIRVQKAAVFTNYLSLKRTIETAMNESGHVVVDLGQTTLVDHTVLEKLHYLAEDWQRAGKKLTIRGLEEHKPASTHELATRWKKSVAAG